MSNGTLTINSMPTPPANTSFTVSGALTVSPSFTYTDDTGHASPLPSGATVPSPSGNFSFTHPGLSPGLHTISVNESLTGTTASTALSIGTYTWAFCTPGSGSFTYSGNTYSVDGSGNADENGTAMSGGSGTLTLALLGGLIVQRTSSTAWHSWNGSSFGAAWGATTSGTTINDGNGVMLCNTGMMITLTGSHGQVAFDGSIDSTTSNVVLALTFNNVLYYVNTSGQWYKNTARTSGSWTAIAGDPRTSWVFITPASGSFQTDPTDVYTITAGGNFEDNGTLLTGGTGTDYGALLNGQVYGRDSSSKEWFLWNGTAFVGQTQAASGSTVTNGSGFMILSNGSIATIDSNGEVAFNGTDDSSTSNVSLILMYSGALYYEDTSGNWHINTALTAGSWSSTSGDPRTNVPVFADEFQAASLSIGQHMDTTKTWSYVLWYAGTSPNTWDGSLNGNGFFVNPLNAATPISGLYGVDGTDNAVLELFATPSMYSTACSNAPYVEAQMVASNFKRTYGYWEVRCKMDSVQGTNTAALWLMSNGINGHYQEIDILEANNQTGNAAAFQTIHYDNSTQDQAATYYGTSIAGTAYDSTAYHVYAVNWQPDFTTFYIDGVQTLQVATPSWYTDPMFPIVSMQAGSAGGWTPAIPGGATLPQHLYIDYIRCYPTKP